MKYVSVDVKPEAGAAEIAAGLAEASSHEEPTVVQLIVRAPSGAKKFFGKLLGGYTKPNRAARGSALVARGFGSISAQTNEAGDDVVSGSSPAPATSPV
ncbi:MAG TPA: hypothetical protein VF407_12505 [Polyangiaceae bacterium]